MNKKLKIGVPLFLVVLLFSSFAISRSLAVVPIPHYDGTSATELRVIGLPGSPGYIFGRADNKNILINPSWGELRYPTLYNGNKTTLSPSGNSSVNAGFGITGFGATGQPYYHLVPLPSKDSSRNIIETKYINESIIRNIYNGNGDFVINELPKYEVEQNGKGTFEERFHYIRDIAHYSGGEVWNDVGVNGNGTNLQFIRTSWPDITNFSTDSNEVNLGDIVRFSFDGYEYVSEGRTGVDATIIVSKDGTIEFENKLSFHSTKPSLNAAKPNEEHAGKFNQQNIGGWSPSECGDYTAELKVDDEVKRFATEAIQLTVGGEECDPPEETGPTCSLEVEVNETDEMKSKEEQMLADPKGLIIESDESSEFDVLEYGIPSSEYLKVFGESEKYLTDYRYQNMTGNVTYTINVKKKYHLKWRTEHSYSCGTEEEPDTCYYYVNREAFEYRDIDFKDPYTVGYWQIGHLNVYSFIDAVFKNYALPNEEVIVPNPLQATARSKHSDLVEDHVFLKDCKNVDLGTGVINGGSSRPSVPDESSLFEDAAELTSRTPDVKNDMVEVDEFLSMDDILVPGIPGNTHVEGPEPLDVPLAPLVPVEEESLLIDPKKANKWETESSITARYDSIHTVNVDFDNQGDQEACKEGLLTTGQCSKNVEFTGYSPDKINTVTVHTPVVMYAESSDDKEHDQRTNPPERSTPPDPEEDRHAYILDRPFEVTLPTYGQHLDEEMAPGYGNRDYAKYFREKDGKQVKFPFDVYTETKLGFYPANTWINIPIDEEKTTFFLPVWVPEGEYTVDFRSIAINMPDSKEWVKENMPWVDTDPPEDEEPFELPPDKVPVTIYDEEEELVDPEEEQERASDDFQEHHANLNMEFRAPNEVMGHHIAYDTIEVDVVGRLYDFRVTDILDFNWSDVFRTTEGLIQHTGNYYWVGNKKIDGDPRGNRAPFTLPIRHGSHPKGYPNEMKNVAVKTGYQFKFAMKTKGNLWDSNDAIRIKPSFYFVNKDGSNRQPVDIYYHSDSNYFVKIGSEQDKEYRKVTLNEPLRNVEKKQLVDTAEFTYRHPDEYGYRNIVDELSKTKFIRNFDRDYTKKATLTGPYSWQILNHQLRTLIGPDAEQVPENTMVPENDIKAREQMWYAEYSLPADIYVVEQGRDIAGYGVEHRLTKKSPIFFQDGYIIVNFNIETIDNGDTENPRLQYHKGPLNNQWAMEGFKYNFNDPYGNNFDLIDGDVIFYHGDMTSYGDFKSTVTH